MVTVATKPRYSYTDEGGAHCHMLDNRPLHGTSTVVKEVIKPPLTWWAAGKALEPLGWLNAKKSTAVERTEAAELARAKIANMRSDGFAALLQKCYRAHADYSTKAADDGTAMHEALECYVQDCIDDMDGKPHRLLKYGHGAVEVFAEWASENVHRFLWAEKHCYSERLWVGGISDCGAILMDETVAGFDFKSSKEAYFSQFVQCGGYAAQIWENGLFGPDGTSMFNGHNWMIEKLIVFPFRGDGPRIESAGAFKRHFEHVLDIYKGMQAYDNGN